MERLIMIRAAIDTGFVSALSLAGLVYCLHMAFG